MSDDTETLAEVRLTDAEREALWQHVRITPSNHDRSQVAAAVNRIIAARIEQTRAGEGALRERVEALVSQAERTMPPPSCSQIDAGIRASDKRWLHDLRAALTDTAGDDRGECGDYPAPCNHDPAHLGAGEGR